MERVHDVGVPASSTAASDVQDQVIHDPVMSFIRGSFNQGHKRFGPNRHKQCATNSVTAVMTNVVKSAWTWTQTDIDNVLVKGNDLYTYMKKHHMISDAHRSGYIFVRELPREHVLCNNTFRLEYLDTLTGDIDVEDYDPALQDVAMPLDVAFQRAMFQADACLLTIRKNMCVVFKQGSRFAVFDPHARGDDGGWQPDGSSIIAYYDSLDALYTHITKLVQSLYAYDAHARDKLFEVTGVKAVVVVPHSSTSDTAVHGTSAHVHDCDEVSGEGCSVDFEPETVTDREQSEIVTVTDREQQSETVGGADDTDDESSICLVSETNASNVTFKCLTLADKRSICTKLGIVSSLNYEDVVVADCLDIEQPEPCTTIDIQPDGNCFFRSMSHVFSGLESYHRAIRVAVVKHIEHSTDVYRNVVRQEFTSVRQYITDSRMKYVTWATELEIQAAADLFKVNIYTYSRQKWLKYSSSGATTVDKGIYLKHCNECHYEPIACVKDNISSKCFSLSTLGEMSHANVSFDVISPRKTCNDRLKRKEREKYADDSEFRKHKIMKVQHRYSTDNKYRQTKQQASVTKYATNEEHKAKVIQTVKDKYSTNQQYRTKLRQQCTKIRVR